MAEKEEFYRPEVSVCVCRGAPGKGLVAPLVHLLVSGGPSDQARAARALSNMATDSAVKEQIVAAGMFASSCAKILTQPTMFTDQSDLRSEEMQVAFVLGWQLSFLLQLILVQCKGVLLLSLCDAQARYPC